MEAKRIGSLLVVGLLVLSAMVAVIGTAAASPRKWPVNFEGTITDSYGKPVSANVQITGKGHTWSAHTNPATGFFRTKEGHVFTPKAGRYVMLVSGESDTRHTKDVANWMRDDTASPGESETRYLADNDFKYRYCEYVCAWDRNPEPIPEFSTIAIPIASILGLLFFFNRRKHRKE
jgi:hypothetical protein